MELFLYYKLLVQTCLVLNTVNPICDGVLVIPLEGKVDSYYISYCNSEFPVQSALRIYGNTSPLTGEKPVLVINASPCQGT